MTVRSGSSKSTIDPGNSARGSLACNVTFVYMHHGIILCTARRAPGREGRVGPDGTARSARREGCSGKTREEGKLQRGPPTTADRRSKQLRTTIYSVHSSDRIPLSIDWIQTCRKQKEIKIKKKKRYGSRPILFLDILYVSPWPPVIPLRPDSRMLCACFAR